MASRNRKEGYEKHEFTRKYHFTLLGGTVSTLLPISYTLLASLATPNSDSLRSVSRKRTHFSILF